MAKFCLGCGKRLPDDYVIQNYCDECLREKSQEVDKKEMDMGERYAPELTKYFNRGCNAIIRLNPKDTKELKKRLRESGNTKGVNLVLMEMRGAISSTYSTKRGEQTKFIAFSANSFSPGTVMKGYQGRWSHIELCVDEEDARRTIKEFLEAKEGLD